MAYLSGNHAHVGEPNYDLLAEGRRECRRTLPAAQMEVGVADRLRLVDRGRLIEVRDVARQALDFVDDEGVFAVVDDAVGPALNT